MRAALARQLSGIDSVEALARVAARHTRGKIALQIG